MEAEETMFVDIELFSEDPLDNVVPCLKFQFDKVIFFGYAEEQMDEVARKTVERFLKSPRVGVKEIQFVQLSDQGYADVEQKISAIVAQEKAAGNSCYIDITGGDELALAAAGMVSTKHEIPMMMVDIDADEVQLLVYPEKFDELPARALYLRLEEFFHLHEAVVDWSLHKRQNEQTYTPEFAAYIFQMKNLMDHMGKKWNLVSLGLSKLSSGQGLDIYRADREVQQAAKVAHMNIWQFTAVLEKLARKHILRDYFFDGYTLRFSYANEFEKALLCDGGSILEHYAYCRVMAHKDVTDCGLGYFLDWEGDGDPSYHTPDGQDVINEIDVVFMRKNVPTFISCKNKLVATNQPLYELDTVADRFGGEHVHKVLFARGGVSPAVRNRAKEMNIRVIRDMD